MNDQWREWVNNKIYLLSTPVGAGVGIGAFVIGILVGKLILQVTKGI